MHLIEGPDLGHFSHLLQSGKEKKKKKAQHPVGVESATSRVFVPEVCALPAVLQLLSTKWMKFFSSTFLNCAYLYLSCCQMAPQGFFPSSYAAARFEPRSAR